jgi:hypothetical protein
VTLPRASVVLLGWLQVSGLEQVESKLAEVTMVGPVPLLGTATVWVTLPRES